MKKIFSLLLTLALLLSLSACHPSAPTQAVTTQPTTWASEAVIETTSLPPQAEIPTTEPAPTEPPTTVLPTTEPESTPPATQPEPTQPRPTEAPTEAPTTQPTEVPTTEPEPVPDPHGTYTYKDDVALYIHIYGRLPDNFITKSQARSLGWSGGSLEPYAPGKCIGGDRFYNREGLLPAASGRIYTECDIGTLGKSSRGAKRIVFSNDGLIYYTSDHYASFTLLYGEP